MQYDLIRSIYGYHRRNAGDEPFAAHMHESYEIYVFFEGDAQYFVENKKYVLQPCDLMVFNGKELHGAVVNAESIYDRYTLHFPPMLVRPLCTPENRLLGCFEGRDNGEGNLRHMTTQQCNRLEKLLDKQLSSLHDTSAYANILALSTLMEILIFLNERFDKPVGEAPQLELSPEVVGVIEHINNNLDGDLSLETLAELHFIDKYYLCRKFKAECGITLHQHIVSKRLLYAKELLSQGKGITEACVGAGFNDYSNFMRTFKKATGKTPMEYMRGQI